MSRYTKSYISFIDRLDEVGVLNGRAFEIEKADPFGSAESVSALCRGATVLLCSHIEGYFRNLSEIALDALHEKSVKLETFDRRILYHVSKDIIQEIRDTVDEVKLAEKIALLMRRDGFVWQRKDLLIERLDADRFLKGFASPSSNRVTKLMRRFGYEEFKVDVARKLAAEYNPTIVNMDNLVNSRNKIAHGDINERNTPSDVREYIKDSRRFCRTIDDCFASWFGRTYCSIRS